MNWPVALLGDVCEINPKLPKGTDEFQKVSFLQMSSVSEQGELLEQEERVLGETKKGFTYFEKRDVLLAKITPCFENGKAAFTDCLEHKIGYGSTEFHVLRAKEGAVDGKYIFYLIWNSIFRFYGKHAMKGAAGQKRVGADFLKKFKVPLPPLAEQKKIAAILDAADQLRQKDQQLIDHYTALSQSLFLEMFGDPVSNPMGWEKSLFGEVFDTKTGKLDSNAASEHGEYPFFTCAKEALSINTYSYDCEALLLAGNNAAGIFDVKYFKGKFDAYQRTYILSIKKSAVLYSFMKKALEHKLNDLQRLSIGSSTQYLTMKILDRLDFVIPPAKMQEKFEESVQEIDRQRVLAEQNLLMSQSLFNSLLQKAFKGELTSSKAA